MADFPSLHMLRPSEGLTPLPTQERILDFTPIMQALASAPQASSTGKTSKDGGSEKDPGWSEMRLGYAQQMFAKQKSIADQMRAMEMAYGPDIAQQMPEYQQLEYEHDDATHLHKFALGKIEKEKVDAYEKNVAAKQGGDMFHLGQWYKGKSLRTHTQHISELQTTESRNYDPTSKRAKWDENFTRNPTFYNDKDAREEVDAILNPAFQAMESSEWASIDPHEVGAALGILTSKGGSGANWKALSHATKQALAHAGFEFKQVPKKDKDGKEVKDKDGNVVMEEEMTFGSYMFDETSPLSGYTQTFLQRGIHDGKGNIYDRTTGELLANDDGFTKKGEEKLSEYISQDIAIWHQEKRQVKQQTISKSFNEYTPDGYGAGRLNKELENVDGLTRYRDGVGLTTLEGYSFEDLAWAGLTNDEMLAMQKPEAGYFNTDGTPTAKYNEWLYNRQADFDKTIDAQLDGNGNVVIPAMYVKVPGTDGSLIYQPNPEYFDNVDKNSLQTKKEMSKRIDVLKKQAEEAQAEGDLTKQADILAKVNDEISRLNTLQTMVDNGRAKMISQRAQKTAVEVGVHKAVYTTNVNTHPEMDKAIEENLIGGQTNNMPNNFMFDGIGYTSINAIEGGTILVVTNGMEYHDAPSMANRGRAKATQANKNWIESLAKAGDPEAANYSFGKDGFMYYKGRIYETSVNMNGDIDNPGYQGDEKNGFRLRSMTDDERNQRGVETYYAAKKGNGEAYNTSPTAAVKGAVIGVQDLSAFSKMTVDVPAPYQYPEKAISVEADKMRSILGSSNMKLVKTATGTSGEAAGFQGLSPAIKTHNIATSIDLRAAEKLGINVAQLQRDVKAQGVTTEEGVWKLAAGQALKNRGATPSKQTVFTSVPVVKQRVETDYLGVPKVSAVTIDDIDPVFKKRYDLKPVDLSDDKTLYGNNKFIISTQIGINDALHRVSSDYRNSTGNASAWEGQHWNTSFKAASENGAKIPVETDSKGVVIPIDRMFKAATN